MRPSPFAFALVASTIVTHAWGGKAPAPVRLVDTPCAGCRAVLPSTTEPVPLLVVLHGDWGHPPAELLSSWERHALQRGAGVLALSCPRDLGCNGSWWRWDGDPAWVTAQVDALASKHAIDRSRVWLAGWSGGASYIGLRAQDFQRRFAAVVYHGGGIPPADITCAVAPSAPVYFLVGDKNPLHHLALRLRQHHERCTEPVTWNLVAGADHSGEWTALESQGGAILAWLASKRMPP